MANLFPYAVGFAVLAMVSVVCKIVAGTWNPFVVARGEDGRPSTSKLQFWLWTLVVLFSYTALYAARAWYGFFASLEEMPRNLLLAMGFSIVTAAAAKGITVAYIASGQLVKKSVNPATGGPGGIFQDDKGLADLAKIQMMAWTFIAIGVYLVNLVHVISFTHIQDPKQLQLPDIDGSLMVLMGLGQGAYLGKKLTTTTIPRLTGLSPGAGRAGDVLSVSGNALGAQMDGNQITIDGFPLSSATVRTWEETRITFTLPGAHPNGTAWTAGQRVSVGVIVGGQESANQLPFTLV